MRYMLAFVLGIIMSTVEHEGGLCWLVNISGVLLLLYAATANDEDT